MLKSDQISYLLLRSLQLKLGARDQEWEVAMFYSKCKEHDLVGGGGGTICTQYNLAFHSILYNDMQEVWMITATFGLGQVFLAHWKGRNYTFLQLYF